MVNTEIYIGDKDMRRYVNAALFSLSKNKRIVIKARGKHIKKAIDVVATLLRMYADASYSVKIDNVRYNDRFLTSVQVEFNINS